MENKNCSWEYIHCTVSNLLKLSKKELSVVPSETIIDLFYAAEEYSIMKTQELADTLGFDKLNSVKMVCFRKASRLGDCDKVGNIRIDFKSLFGYDYDGFISILIHELCHTVQLNHTKEFWTIFEQSAKRVGLLPSEYDGWQETKLEQDPPVTADVPVLVRCVGFAIRHIL